MTATDRRTFLASLAAWPAAAYAFAGERRLQKRPTGSHPMTKQGGHPLMAISSRNGLQATKIAFGLLKQGADTLLAAVEGVTVVENDPRDTSVGYGGLPNEEGVVELDAAVMHGPTHKAGAVAALRNIRNPARVAMRVMQRSDHVLLVGEGALRFAKAHGFQEENLLTEKARKIWLYWKETNTQRDDWLPPPKDQIDPDVAEFFQLSGVPLTPDEQSAARGKKSSRKSARTGRKFPRPTGTVHCATMNSRGDISCTTTTSGLAFKIPGRVGDSPIIGAGLYCDNDVGSCGSTGRGEANLQNLSCYLAVELMRRGASPKDAGLEVLKRVVQHTKEKRLLDQKGRPDFGLKFYLLNKKGEYAGVSMWGPAEFSVTDANGTRHEACAYLYKKA